MTNSANRLLIAITICLLNPSLCSARSEPHAKVTKSGITSIDQVKFCKNCPIFVRVPINSDGIRNIKYVSKYELTWNKYLESYYHGNCIIPDINKIDNNYKDIIQLNIEDFRIDWPIAQLGVKELKCYMEWLQNKTNLIVALPTGQEWEWFARAGRLDVKFPWGNSPDPNHEALKGAFVDRANEGSVDYDKGGKYLVGVRVGLFPPNAWGLYDIMGNLMELTSDTVSGEDRLRMHPNSAFAKLMRDESSVLLAGSDRYDPQWMKVGISARHYALVLGGRYTTNVGIRLILIKREHEK